MFRDIGEWKENDKNVLKKATEITGRNCLSYSLSFSFKIGKFNVISYVLMQSVFSDASRATMSVYN